MRTPGLSTTGRALGGLARGAVAGLLLGVSARVLMRVVAMGAGLQPAFDPRATGLLVGLFVLSGAGAGLAGALALEVWTLTVVVALSSGPLAVMGVAFTVGEVDELLSAGGSTALTTGLLAVAGAIMLLVASTPVAGWRAGARPRRTTVAVAGP